VRKVEESCSSGQAITEYALLLALIVVLVVGILRFVGIRADRVFSRAADAFQSHTAPDSD